MVPSVYETLYYNVANGRPVACWNIKHTDLSINTNSTFISRLIFGLIGAIHFEPNSPFFLLLLKSLRIVSRVMQFGFFELS